MGKSLADYAAEHPTQEPPEQKHLAEVAKSIKERQEERQEAEQLKQHILTQLDQGTAPEAILYTALKCIGLYTNDQEFTATGQAKIKEVYADLEQRQLFRDNLTEAANKLKEQQAEYNKKLRNSINRDISGYDKISRKLHELLTAIDEQEGKATPAGKTPEKK